MKIKFCPKWRNTDLIFEAGGISAIMKCKKCGFQSTLFPEMEIKKIRKRKK